MLKIFVGGLSPDVSEMDLVIFVSNYAEVRTVKLVREKSTSKSKGYAFLEMTNQQEAEKAVSELNDMVFRGKTLTVKIAAEEPAKNVKPFKSNKPVTGPRPDQTNKTKRQRL